jgi:hypothetical protein
MVIIFDEVGRELNYGDWVTSNNTPSNPIPFTGGPSLRVFFDQGVARLNAEVCADNLPGQVVTAIASRPGRQWAPVSQTASGRCVTFWDLDGAGDVFRDVAYTVRVALQGGPDINWSVPCYAATGGVGLCGQAQYPNEGTDGPAPVTPTPVPPTPVTPTPVTPTPPAPGVSSSGGFSAVGVKVGELVTVTLGLNLAGASVSGAEFSCRVDETKVAYQSYVQAGRFGNDPVVVSGAQPDGSRLWVIAAKGSELATQDGTVFTVMYQAVQAGAVTLDCEVTVTDANNGSQRVAFAPATLTIEVVAQQGTVTGAVQPAGAVVVVVDGAGQVVGTATVGADGQFSVGVVPGSYTLRADAAGYLPAAGQVTVTAGAGMAMPAVRLLAGDVNDDNAVIDELDVMTLARAYKQSVPPGPVRADVTGDGVVDLRDLRALAANFRQTGPTAWK